MGASFSGQSNAPPAARTPPTHVIVRRSPAHAASAAAAAEVPNQTSLDLRRSLNRMFRRSSHTGTGQGPRTQDGVPTEPSSFMRTDDHTVWCFIKAKTRVHNSQRLIRRSAWFEAKPGLTMAMGKSTICELYLEDERCADVSARLVGLVNDGVSIIPQPMARTYLLIGMSVKHKSTPAPLIVGSVIKVGSVSLEVTHMCTDEGENFIQRFETELLEDEAQRRNESLVRLALSGESVVDSAGSDDGSDDDEAGASPSTHANAHQAPGGDAGSNPPPICYICWGGPDDPVSAEELSAVRRKGERRHQAADKSEAAAGASSAAGTASSPNPLIRNPCGKCSGSSRYVHLQCMLTWIKSSGSGHCSICNGALPQHFSSPPPNLELKVVRHRRGQSWAGTRRFRLSFADRPSVIIGRDSEADVRLPDRSVCPSHARITFDTETRQFLLEDAASVTGTYIQLSRPMDLPFNESTYLKIGRTTVSMKLSTRRNSLVRSFLPILSTR